MTDATYLNLIVQHGKDRHPDPQFHTDADYLASIERSKAAQLTEQLSAAKQVPALRTHLLKCQPILGARAPLSERLACADALDTAVETFGLALVMRCLALVCAANNIDISTRTINELAAGEEQQ